MEKLFKEKYGDNTNTGFMLNDFNNIKKNPNESKFDFNVIFQKGMYKLFQAMKLNEDVFLTTYFNAFNRKMAYQLRDKEPTTLRDAFKIAVNIENNRKNLVSWGGEMIQSFLIPRIKRKKMIKSQQERSPKNPQQVKLLTY